MSSLLLLINLNKNKSYWPQMLQ